MSEGGGEFSFRGMGRSKKIPRIENEKYYQDVYYESYPYIIRNVTKNITNFAIIY